MKCMITPKLYHGLSALFTIGYLCFDLFMTSVFNHDPGSALSYQTYAHHIAGIISFYTALVLRPSTSPIVICAVAN